LKTSKISVSLSSFLDLEELKGKGEIVLKLELNELVLTFRVLVVFSIYGGRRCFFFILNSVSISSSSSISIYFDLCSSSSFPLRNVITLTFSFGFNVWEGNFPFICAPISPHLKLLAPFASLSCECFTLFPIEKT
jgi:hypothetical protein